MAHMPNTRLPALTLSADKKWLHCPRCSTGYWGAFRPTDFVAAKFAAHVERKHNDAAPVAEAGAEAPAAAPAKAPAKARKAPAKAKVAKAAAKAKAKGDGEVKLIRPAGPSTADLLGDAMADILNDMQGELAPRLQLGQAARDFADSDGNRDNRARMAGRRGPRLNTRGQQALAAAAQNEQQINADWLARRVA